MNDLLLTDFKTTIWEDNMGALTLAQLDPGQHRQAQPHGERAEGQRCVAGHAELHDGPVQAPDQGDEDQQEELASAEHGHGAGV